MATKKTAKEAANVTAKATEKPIKKESKNPPAPPKPAVKATKPAPEKTVPAKKPQKASAQDAKETKKPVTAKAPEGKKREIQPTKAAVKTGEQPAPSKTPAVRKTEKNASPPQPQPVAVQDTRPAPRKQVKAAKKEPSIPEPPKINEKKASKWLEIRSILLQMKSDTLQEISKIVKNGTNTPLVGDPSGDIYDQASSERDRELELLLGDRDREKLHNIDEALLRMDEDEYGTCEECEEEIPIGRLKVMPFTRYCVRCKEGIEREQAQTRRFEEDRAYREIPMGVEEEDM